MIKPHVGMKYPLEKIVSNPEEIFPPGSMEDVRQISVIQELPLVGFTLLTQMAAGLAVSGLLISSLPASVLSAIAILLAVGGLISFLHLGRKRNAWRAVMHLRKSWLSREILMAGLFTIAWAVAAGAEWLRIASPNPWPMAFLGLGLVYSMSRVYRLRAVPSWNTWRTPVAFYLSAIVLGVLGMRLFMPLPGWEYGAGLSLAVELGLALTAKPAMRDASGSLRVVLLGLGILGLLLSGIFPQVFGIWMAWLVFIIALLEEGIGRWQFYAGRVPFPLRTN